MNVGNTDHETGDIGVQWLLLARIRFTSLMSERDLQLTCHCTAPGRSSQIRACPAEMVACRNQIASDLLRRQVACAKGNAPPRESSVRHRCQLKAQTQAARATRVKLDFQIALVRVSDFGLIPTGSCTPRNQD